MRKLLHFIFISGFVLLYLAACVPVGTRIETLTSAPSPTHQAMPTQVSGSDPQTKTFSSGIYHYKVSYPADWTIQVNTTAPARTGSFPEYVTFTSNNPSRLPRIDIEVLTDAPPMVGFESCDHNFVFRNIPACKISRSAGQTPASEVWVFQNGSAYFFIGMQYQGSEPVQIFTDFLMSFELTQNIPTPLPQPTKGI